MGPRRSGDGNAAADHGADVVTFEPPGGDPFRSSAGYNPLWRQHTRSIVEGAGYEGAEIDKLAGAKAVFEEFGVD